MTWVKDNVLGGNQEKDARNAQRGLKKAGQMINQNELGNQALLGQLYQNLYSISSPYQAALDQMFGITSQRPGVMSADPSQPPATQQNFGGGIGALLARQLSGQPDQGGQPNQGGLPVLGPNNQTAMGPFVSPTGTPLDLSFDAYRNSALYKSQESAADLMRQQISHMMAGKGTPKNFLNALYGNAINMADRNYLDYVNQVNTGADYLNKGTSSNLSALFGMARGGPQGQMLSDYMNQIIGSRRTGTGALAGATQSASAIPANSMGSDTMLGNLIDIGTAIATGMGGTGGGGSLAGLFGGSNKTFSGSNYDWLYPAGR